MGLLFYQSALVFANYLPIDTKEFLSQIILLPHCFYCTSFTAFFGASRPHCLFFEASTNKPLSEELIAKILSKYGMALSYFHNLSRASPLPLRPISPSGFIVKTLS